MRLVIGSDLIGLGAGGVAAGTQQEEGERVHNHVGHDGPRLPARHVGKLVILDTSELWAL